MDIHWRSSHAPCSYIVAHWAAVTLPQYWTHFKNCCLHWSLRHKNVGKYDACLTRTTELPASLDMWTEVSIQGKSYNDCTHIPHNMWYWALCLMRVLEGWYYRHYPISAVLSLYMVARKDDVRAKMPIINSIHNLHSHNNLFHVMRLTEMK